MLTANWEEWRTASRGRGFSRQKSYTTWDTQLSQRVSIINFLFQQKKKVKSDQVRLSQVKTDQIRSGLLYIADFTNCDKSDFKNFLQCFQQSIRKAKIQTLFVLIAGNINAKSLIWGSRTEDKRRKHFAVFLVANQLVCSNVSSKPAFMPEEKPQ